MENKEITILDLVKIAIRWIWVLIIGAVICSAVAFFYSTNLVTPMYSAKSEFLIQTKDQGIDSDVLESQRTVAYAQLVVGTYIDILDTRNFAEEVCFYMNGYVRWGEDSDAKVASLKELGLAGGTPLGGKEYNADSVNRMLSYSTAEESTTFSVSANSSSYKEAFAIVRCVEIVVADYIEEKFPGVGVVTVIDKAVEKPSPINNNTTLLTLVGFVAGFVLAFVVVYVIELADNRIKNEDELAAKTGLSVVGIIPDAQYERGSTTAYDKRLQ